MIHYHKEDSLVRGFLIGYAFGGYLLIDAHTVCVDWHGYRRGLVWSLLAANSGLTRESGILCNYRRTFKDNLSYRHEKEVPEINIFVCMADPAIEPVPMINTVFYLIWW